MFIFLVFDSLFILPSYKFLWIISRSMYNCEGNSIRDKSLLYYNLSQRQYETEIRYRFMLMPSKYIWWCNNSIKSFQFNCCITCFDADVENQHAHSLFGHFIPPDAYLISIQTRWLKKKKEKNLIEILMDFHRKTQVEMAYGHTIDNLTVSIIF